MQEPLVACFRFFVMWRSGIGETQVMPVKKWPPTLTHTQWSESMSSKVQQPTNFKWSAKERDKKEEDKQVAFRHCLSSLQIQTVNQILAVTSWQIFWSEINGWLGMNVQISLFLWNCQACKKREKPFLVCFMINVNFNYKNTISNA